MKNGKCLVFAIVILSMVTFLAVGCGSAPNTSINTVDVSPADTQATSSTAAISTTAMDYFPHAVGTTWTWEIRLDKAIPMQNWVTYWPQAGKLIAYRDKFLIAFWDDTYVLTLEVVDLVNSIQVGEENLSGVELQIVRDDLGVFQGANRLYWVFKPSDKDLVVEVVSGLPGSSVSGQPSVVQGQEGISARPIFFDGSVKQESDYTFPWNPYTADDVLSFEGAVGDTWTFVRKVAAEDPEDPRYAAFTETVTYKQGVGMTSLRQEVGGTTSMTWTLVDFSH